MALWRRPRRVIGPVAPPPTHKPSDVPAAALPPLERGEKVLATAQEDSSGHWLVLTTWRLLERTPDGMTVREHPWHELDTGAWDPDTWTLTASFVDAGQPRQWALQRRTGPGMVPEVFHGRTSASVVLLRSVDLGPRRTARVSIRKDLRTRELLEQVLMGKGSRRTDAALMEQVLIARQEVRGQVGLDPVAPTG